jgi:DNA-binding transcriptional ArsR family regulator
MAEKHLMIDLDDPRTEKIAEIMANKSARKIIGVLAEKQLSEGDIAKQLGMPINSVEYNLKKLISVGLVEKTSDFFWSSRGKKIPVYRIADRKIVISPRTGFKGIIPAVLISGAIAAGIWKFGIGKGGEIVQNYAAPVADKAMLAASEATRCIGVDGMKCGAEAGSAAASSAADLAVQASGLVYPDVSLWFLFGALSAILIFLAWNWRKIWN